ncbi:hypothetical protein C8A03DRAFT_17048 [Achaetomium macrosporum]|uniref:C2H2-type domain-containing protein n=1 Tax=Achaetomium macrosporum TaxID=79813 RepID=A0AAN7HAF1_9PEZI|nr:hypothetical protein C8A03DRAFT_17048 [Achaetomium macrosporum]
MTGSLTRVDLPPFKNEMTRFKMWVGNLGAHQGGRTSLDYRLREAPHLREQVLYLLRDASESLEDTLATIRQLASVRSPQARSEDITEKEQTEAAEKDMDGRSEDSLTESDVDEPSPEMRISRLYADIREITDCLLRLSVAIANPAPHERFRKFGAEDISYREPHDIAYVRDKFPRMNPEMATMLGKAITRRRQFFRYRQAHHEKLAAGLEESSVLEPTAEEERGAPTERFSETIASTLPEHIKAMTDPDLRNDVIDEDNRSDTAASVTSYATSAGFVAGEADIAPPLRVPGDPLRPGAMFGKFECPYCHRIISASTRAAWKHVPTRHVFGDLRPYTCVFQDCIDSSADFDRRGRWRAHISQHNWKSWSCPFQCDSTRYASALHLRAHLIHRHIPNAPADQLEAVVAVGEGQAGDDSNVQCPMCKHPLIGLRQYTRHVGRRLEQLALFALPDLEEEQDIQESATDDDEPDWESETESAASEANPDGKKVS